MTADDTEPVVRVSKSFIENLNGFGIVCAASQF